MVCIANADGGKILVGVNDNSYIVGVSDIYYVMLRLNDLAMNRAVGPR